MNKESEAIRLREWLELIANGPHSHPARGQFAEPCDSECPVFNAKRALEGE